MKTVILIALIVSVSLSSEAATFRVAKDGIATYSEVQPAIYAATAGDTIYVAASPARYQGFSVDRRLVIYGAGTDTIPGQATIVDGIVRIFDTADSTELNSTWLSGGPASNIDSGRALLIIHSGSLSVRISRCYIENIYGASAEVAGAWIGSDATATFIDCGFWLNSNGGSWEHSCILMTSWNPGCQVSIFNCAFVLSQGNPSYFGISSRIASNTLAIRHCIFDNCNGVGGSAVGTMQNSASPYAQTSLVGGALNMAASYCSSMNYLPYGSGNFALTGAPFANHVPGSLRRSDYHLSANSVLHNTGNPLCCNDLEDGSQADIGIYGGQTPFVQFGIPDFPVVLELEVPASVPQNGVLHIGSRGRVGPGNQ